MAATATATAIATEEQAPPQVPLRILVDKEKNRVLFAEAGKDFVDVLLSFLTFPLGTIARLVRKESNTQPVRVGCLSSLYESVVNLDEKHFWTETCKDMLLHPRNPTEAYCQNLKLNIDDTEPTKYFICEKVKCYKKHNSVQASRFRNKGCRCGGKMSVEASFDSSITKELINIEGYVQETATFIISDDLMVMPHNILTSVDLLKYLGFENMDAVKEMTVNVSQNQVVDLLKCSLLKTPLTNLFLSKNQFHENCAPNSLSMSEIGEVGGNGPRQIKVKVMERKSDGKILFAMADEDFMDFLLSFLTFPLGGVVHMLEGYSSLGSIDRFFKSLVDLNANRYLKSEAVKNMLINPNLSPHFRHSKQILPIHESYAPMYYCRTTDDGQKVTSAVFIDNSSFSTFVNFLDPKSSMGEASSSKGFIKGPSMYKVTDDLVVTPMSSISSISILNSLDTPLNDLEERVVTIGIKEGLSILKASLISTSALTNGLSQFRNKVKDEN